MPQYIPLIGLYDIIYSILCFENSSLSHTFLTSKYGTKKYAGYFNIMKTIMTLSCLKIPLYAIYKR
jgi:hypothetical protein